MHNKLVPIKKVNSVIFSTVLIAVLSNFVKIISAHVSLTYPIARNYDLDFLDNIRSRPPCGQPRGETGTTLMAGSPINISWHLAYPHRGGYRLELLDKDEKFLLNLIKGDKSEGYVEGNPTAQWHTLTIPKDLTCERCTIRLLRQANEWANSYRFWSCADVQIVREGLYKEDCLGHGTVVGENCQCDNGYWGPRCQFREECHSNDDCYGKGTCVDLGGSTLPRKQCFCPPGYHGMQCSLKNKAQLPKSGRELDLKSYTKKELSNKFSLYYKGIPSLTNNEPDNEMEFVLIVNGTSYGAIGWRPISFNKSCKLFPYVPEHVTKTRMARETPRFFHRPNPTLLRPLNDLERKGTESKSGARKQKSAYSSQEIAAKSKPKSKQDVAKPENEPEPEITKPENEPEPEITKPESEPEPEITKPENKPEPQTGAKSKPKSQPEIVGNPENEPEPEISKPENEPEPESVKSKLETVVKPENEPEPEIAKPENEPKPEIVTKSKEKFKPDNISKPENEPGPEIVAENEPEPTAKSLINPEPEPEPELEKSFEQKQIFPFAKESRKSSYTPTGDFHAMDCTDIIIGSARGSYTRILDYYTRDRSTPRLDEFWSNTGSNSITSAGGWEENGVTVLIFRRKIISTEATDHDLKGPMTVIYAKGQEHGNYVHAPQSGLETESPSTPNFYAEDELKYHGHRGQRGVSFIEF